MSRSTATASPLRHARPADDELFFVLAKQPRRLEPLSLVSALHANDLERRADDAEGTVEEAPRSQNVTLVVDPEENLRLLARAFTSSDEQVTLDAPAPVLPAHLPSPLGDDDDAPTTIARAPSLPPLFGDLPDLVPALGTPWLAPAEPGASSARAVSVAPPTFGTRKSVSPLAAQAAREAREAARIARAAEARTRLVVLGIWGTAAMLAALLAFFASAS